MTNAVTNKRNILIVNDDDDLLLSFKIRLKSPELKVMGAKSVAAALEQLEHQTIDVILSDINLGDEEPNGYDLLKHVREKYHSLPFYLLSGADRAQEEVRAKERGATGYLQLPVEKEELLKIVSS